MIYVMSDIHGKLQLLLKMMEQLNLQEEDTLYILGDVIDRGEDSIETLKYVMKHPRIKFLLGNHEDMMLGLYNDDEKVFLNWTRACNGGDVTFKQYQQLSVEERDEIKTYLHQAPLYKIVQINNHNYLLLHAGIQVAEYETIEDALGVQTRRDMLWIREAFYKAEGLMDCTIVFGHTPTRIIHGEDKIWYSHKQGNNGTYIDKIGIDCGSYESSKLACLRLDDLKEFYVV